MPAALLVLAPPVGADELPGTLPLDEALRTLDVENLTLAQARSRAEQAEALVRQAKAPLLPTLSATGSYVRNSDSATAPLGTILAGQLPAGSPRPADIVIQPLQVWNATGALRVPIVNPTGWADLAQERRGAAAAAASSEAVRLQVRATFRQAAWSAAAADEIVAATERALESAREQARIAERALQVGTGTPLAVLQARTEAVRRESDLVRAQADQGRARLALGVLLGQARPVQVLMPDPEPPGALEDGALSAEALEQRPEVRAASEQVAAAERQLDSADTRFLPQLAAAGSAFVQDSPAPTGKYDGWRVSLELSWALYDGGLRYGKRSQAQAAIAEARAAAAAQRVSVVQEVEDAVRDATVAVERLRLAVDQRSLAAETAATARRGFAGGVASSLDVLDANDRLYQSEVGLADARARLGGALAALERAVGRG